VWEERTCLFERIFVRRGKSDTPGCKRVNPEFRAEEHRSVARIHSSRWVRKSKDVPGGGASG